MIIIATILALTISFVCGLYESQRRLEKQLKEIKNELDEVIKVVNARR